MPELFLELHTEEIPARMQAKARRDFEQLLKDRLDAADLKFGAICTFVTPRRLAAMVPDLPAAQPDRSEERRGPRVGAPEKALEGFLRSTGLTLDQCEKRETPKGEFYYAVIDHKGQPTREVLPAMVAEIVVALPWPKSMRWGSGGLRFVRPLHRVTAIFDQEVLPGGVSLAGQGEDYVSAVDNAESNSVIPFGRVTFGHRFLGSGDEIILEGGSDYEQRLQAESVMVSAEKREEIIRTEAAQLARAEGCTLKEDEALVRECAGLVEWPAVLMGNIDEAFMEVPPEVLTTAMRTHQKYFSVLQGDGSSQQLAPKFVLVSNMKAADGGRAIVEGNERVLRARLSDAKFFWDQDRKTPLVERVPRLSEIVFQARLGTVAERATRMQKLAEVIASHVPDCSVESARRAAFIAKADLVTDMVYEFPELQGLMGRYYALHDGEEAWVAQAIADHYSPQGPNDDCPRAPVSVAVALADKIDILTGFFAIDEKPTGSKDPYALRRAALGVIRLVVENELRVPLRAVFGAALELYPELDTGGRDHATIFDELLEFFADRLKVHLKERGVRHDLISAVFALGGEDDLVRLLARVDALQQFVDSEDGANLLTAYRRASNIVNIEEKKDARSYAGRANGEVLVEKEEKQLFEALEGVGAASAEALQQEDFTAAMAALARLRGPVDAFFDAVTVNCDDASLRENRLQLLSQIRAALCQVAEFGQIEGG